MQKKVKFYLGLVALVLSPATAMAQLGEDATIYGKLHVSADGLDDGKDSSVYASSNMSRIGLKGSEELNRSFSFIWQVESNKVLIAMLGVWAFLLI